jgi:hypothetical protein
MPCGKYTFRGHEFRKDWRRGEPKTEIPKQYFIHESMPEVKFRYPIPLGGGSHAPDPAVISWSPILELRSLKTSLRVGFKAHAAKGAGGQQFQPYCLPNQGDIVVGSLLLN